MSTISPEDQKMFDEYRDMFATPGWKRIVDDLQETVDSMDTVDSLDSLLDLGVRQGKIQAYRELITLEAHLNLMEEDYDVRD